MPEYLFANDAVGTLDTAIGTSDITISLETGDGGNFPAIGAGEQFMGLIYSADLSTTEWVTVTAVSGDQLTVTRSASPASFGIGSKIELRLDENALGNLLQKGTERTTASDPDGVLTALYTGEEVLQTTSGVWWKHITSTTWKAMNL